MINELEVAICGTELTGRLITITDVRTNSFKIIKDIEPLLPWIRGAEVRELSPYKFLVDKYYLLEL
ncbi:hypothetical protein [Clostridium butyricum]